MAGLNEVIGTYFDASHRELTHQPPTVAARGYVGSSSQVQLPPVKTAGPTSFVMADSTQDRDFQGGAMNRSASMGAITPNTANTVSRQMTQERYQRALEENAKQQRKIKQLQDTLSITAAKKESFKQQAMRLEKEFKHGREATEFLQKELLEAKRDVEQFSKEAADAVAMMTEMRNGHIREIRLLQRGLAARGGDDKFRNRIDEVADLVDKLGRSVVQREEAIREKAKMQAQLSKFMADFRSISDDHGKLKKQNKALQEKLTKAMRQVKMVEARRPQNAVDPDDSDDEFEEELLRLEKHFEILKDNSAGADVMAMSLSKDKANLEGRLENQKENSRSLKATIEYWMNRCSEKEREMEDKQRTLDALLKQQAQLAVQVKQKHREIGDDVDEERAKMIAELEEAKRETAKIQAERDEAMLNADEMQQAGDKISKAMADLAPAKSNRAGDILQQAEDEYDGHAQRKADRDALATSGTAGQSVEEPEPPSEPKEPETTMRKKESWPVKTGQSLELELFGVKDKVKLRARDVASGSTSELDVSKALIKELDQKDPWTELYNRTGVAGGQIVISEKLGEDVVRLGDADVHLTVFRYDARTFFVTGHNLAEGDMRETLVNVPSSLGSEFDSASGAKPVFDLVAGRLSWDDNALLFSAS